MSEKIKSIVNFWKRSGRLMTAPWTRFLQHGSSDRQKGEYNDEEGAA